MSTSFIEKRLGLLFSYFLTMSREKIQQNHEMSLKKGMAFAFAFGKIEKLFYEFSDFLSSIAIATKEDKIKIYKYEAIEKFFSFLIYFNEISTSLKNPSLNLETFLDQLHTAEYKI